MWVAFFSFGERRGQRRDRLALGISDDSTMFD